MGLHKKLIVSFAAAAIVVIGLFSWQNFSLSKEQITGARRAKIELLTEIINNGLKSLMLEGRGSEFQKFLDNLIAEDIAAIRIFTEDGRILNSTIPGEIGQRIPYKDMSVYRAHQNLTIYYQSADGKKIFSTVVLIRNDRICQRCHGGIEQIRGILDVEYSSHESETETAGSAARIAWTALLTLFCLIGSLGLLSLYLIKRPLAEIAGSIEKDDGGDQLRRLSEGRNDEIGRIAEKMAVIMADIHRNREEIDRYHADRDLHIENMASLGELAAAVAHDIKNPLAGISGALQVLAEDFPEDSPRKEITREILEEIGRLDSAVKDLLLFARPPDMHLIPVDINAIIEKVRDRVAARAATLKVGLDLVPAAVPALMVDPEQLERAFLNIALHSLEAMPYGGQLRFVLRDSPETGEIKITVSDTGPGIPEEKLKDIFKPFFSSKHSGSGLGLAIARNIVKGHRGRIEVESAIGKGTRYTVILPETR